MCQRVDVPERLLESSKLLRETNDCTVLAWANIFDCDYDKARNYLSKFGRQNRRGMLRTDLEKAFAGVKRAKIRVGEYSKTNSITLSKFCRKHPKGRYYVCVRGHALSIKDGIVYDFKDGFRRKVTFAVRVYLEGELK